MRALIITTLCATCLLLPALSAPDLRAQTGTDLAEGFGFSDPFLVDTRLPPGAPQSLGILAEKRTDRVVGSQPVFQWGFAGADGIDVQSAYQCEVFAGAFASGTPVWDSGKTASADAMCRYGGDGASLKDGQSYTVRVRVWGRLDRESDWAALTFRMNTPPPLPDNPRPASGSVQTSDERTLLVHWDLPEDADGDALSASLLGGLDEEGPRNEQTVVDNTTGILSGLSAEGTYYWRVVVTDGFEEVRGPVWTVRGRGAQPAAAQIRVSPESLLFESVAVGAADTLALTVSNAGGDTLRVSGIAFAESWIRVLPAPPYEILSGGTQEVQVILLSAPSSDRETSLTVQSSDPDRPEVGVSLRITVRAQAQMDIAPTALSMGDVTVGSALDTAFVIQNRGSALLTGGIRSRNEAFKVFPDTVALDPGESRSIRVTFSPKEPGFVGSVLVISGNAGEQTVEVTARGVTEPTPPGPSGDVPVLSVLPQPLDFGTVKINETVTLPLLIQNTGSGTLSVLNIASNDLAFSLQSRSDASFDLGAGESRRVQIVLTPSRQGKISATLTIQSNDAVNPNYPVTVQADVVGAPGPDFKVVTPGVDFGQVDFGAQGEFLLIVKNEGVAPGQIYGVRPDNNQVVVTSAVPVTVQPDKTATVVLSYTPAPYRLRQGDISLYTDDEAKPIVKVGWQAQEVPVTAVTVSRTAPSDGDIDVELETRVDVRFSEPLMRLGRHFVAADVEIRPGPVNRGWREGWDLSVDGKTLMFPSVALEKDRIYRLSVLSAVAESGNELIDPVDAAFTTGSADAADAGSISGKVQLTSVVEQPDGAVLADTAQVVEGRVFAVDESDQLVGESRIDRDGAYRMERLPPGDYKVYVEVEGQDRPISVGVDRDGDDRPDVVTVSPKATVADVDAVVSDVKVTEDAPGRVKLDADPSSGNQEASEGAVGADSLVSVAVYVEDAEELTRFETVVEFDDEALEFVGFDVPDEGEGEDEPILKGRRDGAAVTQEKPVVTRSGKQVTVEGDQISVRGQLLDGRRGNAPSGGGLLGILQFAARAGALLAGGKPAAGKAAAGATVSIKEITLLGVDSKKSIRDAGSVSIRGGSSEPSPDFDGDGSVGFRDFLQFAKNFGKKRADADFDPRFDLNRDGEVGFPDFLIFARRFGG